MQHSDTMGYVANIGKGRKKKVDDKDTLKLETITRSIPIYCGYTALVPPDQFDSIQGNLKAELDIEKLADSILKNGWIMPVFAWQQPNERWALIDGVHRLKALALLRDRGHDIEPVPVFEIHAKSIEDAKQKLLLATSRYSKVSKSGFFQFAEDLNLEELKSELSRDSFKFLIEGSRISGDDLPKIETETKKKKAAISQKDVTIRVYEIKFMSQADFKEFWDLMSRIRKAKHKKTDYKDILLAIINHVGNKQSE